MAKQKVSDAPVFSSWSEVDDALRQIREIDAKVAKAEAQANTLRQRADALVADVAEDLKQKKQLEKNMTDYCTAQLPEMPQKSRKLNHGLIQFTASKECAVKKGFTIAAALEVMLAPVKDAYDRMVEKLGKRFVRVKCEIDKAGALAAFNAGQITQDKLAGLGLEVIEKENFGYTLADAKAQPTN